ncbi:MAG: hypothetical protein AAGC79_05595 [Pseudomonadota bacterium]
MTAFLTILSLALSTVGAAYLAITNPKRRRAFRQESLESRPYLWLSRVAVLGPGLLFLALGNWAVMVLWAGGITVIGWGIAATSPDHLQQFWAWSAERRGELRTRLSETRSKIFSGSRKIAKRLSGSEREITHLKSRIVELETRISELEGQEAPRISIAASGGKS